MSNGVFRPGRPLLFHIKPSHTPCLRICYTIIVFLSRIMKPISHQCVEKTYHCHSISHADQQCVSLLLSLLDQYLKCRIQF
jgi:hypothetical protein